MKLFDFLPGKKTYLAAWGTIFGALAAVLTNEIAVAEGVKLAVEAVMVMTLRKGIASR